MATKKYKIVYPIVGIILGAVIFGLCQFVWLGDLFYSICFGILASGYALVLARVIMHLIDKDNGPKTWQISFYGLMACGGWTGGVLCESWGFTSLWMCVLATGLVLCFGTRWLKDENEDGIPDVFQKLEKEEALDAQYMYEHMIFKRKNDRLDGEPDQTRPLCLCGGKALTIKEAMDGGYDQAAGLGIEYIDGLYAAK
ncbi:MAG: hypothetical protein WCR70_05360 [Sphaerochaetaceae bacterium]